jgi:hypothetical protein
MTEQDTSIQAQLDSLFADMQTVKANQGDYSIGPLEGTNDIDRPNGEATVVRSLHQLHQQLADWGDINARFAEMQQQLDALGTPAQSPPITNPAPVSSSVVDQLAALGVYVQQNKLGVGIKPRDDSNAAITVGGVASASILGISNVAGTDGQNQNEVHMSDIVFSDNDGGVRARQYATWGPNGEVRNTLNRPFTCVALTDSEGDLCISDSRAPKGQIFYIIKDFDRKEVRLCAFQPGWKVTVESTSEGGIYGAPDVKQL